MHSFGLILLFIVGFCILHDGFLLGKDTPHTILLLKCFCYHLAVVKQVCVKEMQVVLVISLMSLTKTFFFLFLAIR